MANITLQRIKSQYEDGKIIVFFQDKSRPEIGPVKITITLTASKQEDITQLEIQNAVDRASDDAIAKFKEKIELNKIEKWLGNFGKPDTVYKGDVDLYVNKQKVTP